MDQTVKDYLDNQFETIRKEIGTVAAKVQELESSINTTTDENKPSLRQQITLLKLRVSAIETNAGKLWALFGATPISLLVAYAVSQAFFQHK